MPLDPTFVPALEAELEYAKHVKPGGQPVDEGRVKLIEEQIRLHKSAGKHKFGRKEKSNDDLKTTSTTARTETTEGPKVRA